MVLRRRRALVCRRAVELVTDYMEDELSDRDSDRFEAHLAGCLSCRRYLRQIGSTIGYTGRIQPGGLPPEAREELVCATGGGWPAENQCHFFSLGV